MLNVALNKINTFIRRLLTIIYTPIFKNDPWANTEKTENKLILLLITKDSTNIFMQRNKFWFSVDFCYKFSPSVLLKCPISE